MSHTPDINEQVNTAIRGMEEKMSLRTGVKWQLQRTPYESEIDIVSDGRVIAVVEAGEDKEDIARLIVSAPDMLKALEWYGWKVDEGRKNTLEGDRARYDLDRDGGSRAYAAIQKARG
jgi:hypothetical protein